MSKSIAQIRNEAAAALSPERKQQWEQFLTPAPVAEQAAGLFTPAVEPCVSLISVRARGS